ncbi:hypothetical protein CAMRE0001_2764 [Campylobacter rectus RM3267]|uniref:Uncharacterized protein n=1 Tax=Campylobacter rectus RM3267 TaxID=553218 RepID=B9D0W5_CAMRE|nr:hypothetical protein CAMRE0001_2764 [Campylobacter rectus RM3267]
MGFLNKKNLAGIEALYFFLKAKIASGKAPKANAARTKT